MKSYIILLSAVIVFAIILSKNSKTNIKLSGKINSENFKSPVENKLNFLWSKGLWEKSEYVFKDTETKTSLETLKNQMIDNTIWIRTTSKSKEEYCDLDIFSENLDLIKNDITLVTSDGDKSIPSDLKEETYQKIINHPKIKRWFTQNYDGTSKNPKLKPYPIGFDLHTNRTKFGIILPKFFPTKVTDKINYLLSIRRKFSDKENKIFCDVHLSPNSKFNNERTRVKKILSEDQKMFFLKQREDQKSIWKKYGSHKFVISTFGNGLDCHRTWEILFLGGIVITKTSSLDPLFEDLPVVIVKDWDECKDEKNLLKWEEKYKNLTNYNHIDKFFTYNYWLEKKS